MKILFIIKDRFYNKSYELINSSKQITEFLDKIGNKCKIVQVVDENDIDKEIYEYKPNMVIIESLWVTDHKMKELINIPRYKHIKWVIRIHRDIGFLGAETLGLKYVNDYIELGKENLFISCNNLAFNYHLSQTLQYPFIYLPNIIDIKFKNPHYQYKNYIDVACFGSLRISKNQCYQAMCTIDAANRLGKILRFHITVDINIDHNGESLNPVLKNLEELFKDSKHELIKHYWLENNDFHCLIRKMDIGLQVSYTESFNTVSSDFVNQGVPIVVSDAIKWMPWFFKTSTVMYEETIKKIIQVYKMRKWSILRWWMRRNLVSYNENAKLDWIEFMKKFEHH